VLARDSGTIPPTLTTRRSRRSRPAHLTITRGPLGVIDGVKQRKNLIQPGHRDRVDHRPSAIDDAPPLGSLDGVDEDLQPRRAQQGRPGEVNYEDLPVPKVGPIQR
jgi:hypothetical protein